MYVIHILECHEPDDGFVDGRVGPVYALPTMCKDGSNVALPALSAAIQKCCDAAREDVDHLYVFNRLDNFDRRLVWKMLSASDMPDNMVLSNEWVVDKKACTSE